MANHLPLPGEIRPINPQEVKSGPRFWDELDPLLALWARWLFERVGYLIVPTAEKWEEGFLYDARPRSELLVWEAVARAYEAFLAEHPDCDKEGVATNLGLISAGASVKERTEAAEELEALFRRTWEGMVRDTEATYREVFSGLGRWDNQRRNR